MPIAENSNGAPSRFTSRRERRLWLWTLAVLLAIWATLPFQGLLAESLRNRGLLNSTFFYLFLAMMVAIFAAALTRRAGPREVLVGLGIAAAYGMALLRVWSPEERTHLVEYGVVAVLLCQALRARRDGGRRVPAPAVLAIVGTALLGWLDEAIQSFLPARVYDIRDIGFNALAGLMTVLASLALEWARGRDQRAGGTG